MSNGNGNNGVNWLGPHGPGIAGAHGPSNLYFEENQYRSDRNIPPSFQDNKTIEDLMGDGCLDARHYVCDKARPIPGVSSNGPMLIRSIDYPVVGPIGQIRAAAEAMFARGAHMPDQFILTGAGATRTVTFNRDTNPSTSTPAVPLFPMSQGFVVDWGIAMLNFQPFDLEIRSTGWVGIDDGQPLDRSIRIRVERCCGSSVYVPWAMRITPAMAKGVNQLAVPQPQVDGADVSSINVVNLPGNVQTTFSAVVSFMTAASPQVAGYAALTAMYGNVGYQITRPAELGNGNGNGGGSPQLGSGNPNLNVPMAGG
jgi:hypothetical protein